MNSPYFPFYINLKNRTCLVIGAGTIAMRRIRALIDTGVHMLVVYEAATKENEKQLLEWNNQGLIRIRQKQYEQEDLLDFPERHPDFVLAATNDPVLNDEVGNTCRQKNIPVNVASNRELSDFFFPAIIRDDEITIGICGDGTNHSRVAELAKKLRS